MSLLDTIRTCPHLASPAALGRSDSGPKFKMPPHLAVLNRELMRAWFTPNSRLAVTMPFQHAKSTFSSHYFPAWVLLLFPDTRICLASYEEGYSMTWGGKVKDTVERFGRPAGINLRKDTKAKGEWVIEGHGGGMVCKGRHGALTGRPADLLILDDMIKNPEEAMSPTILASLWDWFSTVAFSRLGPTAPIVAVGTRWVKNDLFGRVFAEAREGGEVWREVKFKAIAEKGDVLGRKVGEALWPDRVPLSRLQLIEKKRARWFRACWQQEPEDAQGTYFKPRAPDGTWTWPLYVDTGDAYALQETGVARKVFLQQDCTRILTLDWAYSEKKTADYTAMEVGALTPDARLLMLDVVNERIALHKLAPALAEMCRRWRPRLVCVEVGHPTLHDEYRRWPEIPEIRWLTPDSTSKLTRALPAIIMAENHRVCLPAYPEQHPWLEYFVRQLAGFTGLDDEHDDMVDGLAYLCQQAQYLHPVSSSDADWPDMLVEGKMEWW